MPSPSPIYEPPRLPTHPPSPGAVEVWYSEGMIQQDTYEGLKQHCNMSAVGERGGGTPLAAPWQLRRGGPACCLWAMRIAGMLRSRSNGSASLPHCCPLRAVLWRTDGKSGVEGECATFR